MAELSIKALLYSSAFGRPKGVPPTSPRDKPGYMIEQLSPEERELLKTLTAEDIKDIRWPPY